MRRLARCCIAALLASAFAAPVLAAPPLVMAPMATSNYGAPDNIPPANTEQSARLRSEPSAISVSTPEPRPVLVYSAPTPTPTPAPPTVADAKAYALRTLGRTQYACLASIIAGESRWAVTATNPRSGAYGLPQSLPASKMASAGADWRTNAVTQVRWMIGYVAKKYGSACNAARWRAAHGWY